MPLGLRPLGRRALPCLEDPINTHCLLISAFLNQTDLRLWHNMSTFLLRRLPALEWSIANLGRRGIRALTCVVSQEPHQTLCIP